MAILLIESLLFGGDNFTDNPNLFALCFVTKYVASAKYFDKYISRW